MAGGELRCRQLEELAAMRSLFPLEFEVDNVETEADIQAAVDRGLGDAELLGLPEIRFSARITTAVRQSV